MKHFLSNPTTDQVTSDDVPDIDPTPVNGVDNREFPSFLFKSYEEIQNDGLVSYTCTYDFVQSGSSYGLRPGTHVIPGFDVEPTSGSLKIETQEGCVPHVWKFYQRSKVSESITQDSDTNVFIQWSTAMTSVDSLMIYLPEINGNMDPCYYNLQVGRIKLHQMMSQMCPDHLLIPPAPETVNLGQEFPSFKLSPRMSIKQLCKYGYVQRSGLAYFLRAGDHPTKKNFAMRVILKIQTRKECIPRVLSLDKDVWSPLGTVQSEPLPDSRHAFVVD